MVLATLAVSIVLLIVVAVRSASAPAYAALGLFFLVGGVFALGLARMRIAARRVAKLAQAAAGLHDERKYSDALLKIEEAAEIAKKARLRPSEELANMFVVRSLILKALGRKEDALVASAQALACLCKVKTGGMQLGILTQAGTMLLETGHARRAIPMLEAAIKLALQIEDDPRRSYRLQQVGLAYSRVGLHANAVASFGRAIEIVTKQKGADCLELSNMYINLGNGYKRLQKMDDAERCYREALRLLEVNGVTAPEKVSLVLLNLGVACAESGRNQEAEEYYRQVLEMRLAVYGRNDVRVGRVYNNLASCRRRAGDLAGAEQLLQTAMDILEQDPAAMSNAYDTLCRIREDQGRLEEGLAAIARARDLIQNQSTTDLSDLANLLDREARLASQVADEDRASECKTRANQIRQKLASAPAAEQETSNMDQTLKQLDAQFNESMRYVNSLREVG